MDGYRGRPTHVYGTISVRTDSSKCKDFRARVCDVNLGLVVGVLLFENESHRFFDVDQELARLERWFI